MVGSLGKPKEGWGYRQIKGNRRRLRKGSGLTIG